MTEGNRAALWTLLGLSSVYLAVDFWLATQGGDVRLPSPVEVKLGSHAAAVYGLFIVVPVFAAFLYVTASLLGPRTLPRLARLPHPFGLSIDLSTRLDRRVLGIVTFLFLLVPAAAVVHLENKMLKGQVVVSLSRQTKLQADGVAFDPNICLKADDDYGCTVANDWRSHLFRGHALKPLLSGDYENAFQYDPKDCRGHEGACKGLTFFPFLGPWLMVLAGLYVLAYWFRLVWLILLPRLPETKT